MKYIKNKKILFIAVPVLLVLIAFLFRIGGSDSSKEGISDAVRKIEVITNPNSSDGAKVNTTGPVVSSNEAELKSQASGQVVSSTVKVGQSVSHGQVIAQLNSADVQAQLAQAQAAVDIQYAQLAELERNSLEGSDVVIIEEQQDKLIENAYKTLLNSDLRAYPQSNPAEVSALPPTISGTYASFEEGTYIIETYSSAADSGSSFRLSGLEKNIGSVSIVNPVPLGTRGLYIQFTNQENISFSNKKWVVEIPNKRSSAYVSANNVYEAAKKAKSVALNQSVVSDQRIATQKAQIRQAEANVRAVQAQLAKSTIRAPFSGSIVSISIGVGDYVSTGQSVASIINPSGIHIQTYVSSEESKKVSVGNLATINQNIPAVVTNISSGINTSNGKVEILVAPINRDKTLIAGEYVDVSITVGANSMEGTTFIVPLKAIKPQSGESIIYTVNSDMILEERVVQTGSIIGDSIEITSALDQDARIAASSRGLKAGMKVEIRN